MARWLQCSVAALVLAFAGCGEPQTVSGGKTQTPPKPAAGETREVSEPGLAPAASPAGKAPAEKPPAEKPPAEKPPAEKAPAEKAPAEKPPVPAPKPPDAAVNPEKTGPAVAVVDGEAITLGELDAFMKKCNVPEEDRAAAQREALDELIKRRLLEKFIATRKIELDPEALFNARLHAYLQQMSGGPKSDAEALTLATSIKKELDGGADFAVLAKRHSSCPSSARGGDLRDFAPGSMVPAFTAAVQKLAVNGISDPVKTQFGYHVIQRLPLENAAARDPGMLRARHILVQVENPNSPQVLQHRYARLTGDLVGKAQIEIKLPKEAAEPELPPLSPRPAPRPQPRVGVPR